MSDSPPSFSEISGRLWEQREALYLAILEEALCSLGSGLADWDEPKLNRLLCRRIVSVIRARARRKEPTLDRPPLYDAPLAPLTKDETVRERKRPDLRWELMDPASNDDEDDDDLESAVIPFVIECKRLGLTRGHGSLSELYISTGVVRFRHEDWSYGRFSGAGAMVGYLQSMEFTKVLDEVNLAAQTHDVPLLTEWKDSAELLFSSQHTLDRTFKITPYRLVHHWVDVR